MKKKKKNDTFFVIDSSVLNNKILVVDRNKLSEMIKIERPICNFYPGLDNKLSIQRSSETIFVKKYILLYDEDLLPPNELYEGQLLCYFGFDNEPFRVIIDMDGDFAVKSTYNDDEYNDDIYSINIL